MIKGKQLRAKLHVEEIQLQNVFQKWGGGGVGFMMLWRGANWCQPFPSSI